MPRPPLVAAVAVLLAGCAAIPSNGPVQQGQWVQPDEQQEPRVRVFALPPQGGESPVDVVNGFLDAATNDDSDYAVARQYLAARDRDRWEPDEVQVYDPGDANPFQVNGTQVILSGRAVGTVSSEGSYRPDPPDRKVRETFHLVREHGEWRIADPPERLYVSSFDFERAYELVNVYFFDRTGRTLVPDPVYLRDRGDLVTEVTQRLLRGPTSWLRPAVSNQFPLSTVLATDHVPVDGGIASVQLSRDAQDTGLGERRRMAAQLVWTLTQLPDITGVRIGVKDGSFAPFDERPQTPKDWQEYDPKSPRANSAGYYLNGGRLTTVDGADAGPFGDGRLAPSVVAVAPGGNRVAAVTDDGRVVRVGHLDEGERTEVWLQAPHPLTSLSWDGAGNLWVLGAAGPKSPVYVLQGPGRRLVATVEKLGDRPIRKLRVARDGVRVALIAGEEDKGALLLGRIEWSEASGVTHVVVRDPVPLARQFTSVYDVGWAGPGRLAVLAQDPQGLRQLYYLSVDGSRYSSVVVPEKPVSLAAAQGEPLLVGTRSPNMIWKQSGDSWVKVDEGRNPIYPG
ncbi:LpqB family beta-propeller domain-containing protein [Carbonactinospora thermoautotrophica]|uniref:LpqB family beta-propeller domain-containing protein n=1 Tax=Carbonactinospora thermoautotrophica TaxID=1469144 RepID=UPI000AEC094F|nr:LpqB family beta-propeller domain-containing protein [Carbonactinospora thermoautotrophica]